jgi:hypothetical protein
MTRKVPGTALGRDLGTIRLPTTEIAVFRPGQTHELARMSATDAGRSFDWWSGVERLLRLP